MATMQSQTVSITVDRPVADVVVDLADPSTHPEWATEFFAGPLQHQSNGTWSGNVPVMGGPVSVRVDVDENHGVIDMYFAPEGAPFGPPLPIRVVPNGDGADVLFTLTRAAQTPVEAFSQGVASLERELTRLKARLEAPVSR